MKFDGKGFAQKLEAQLVQNVARLSRKPKIVSILVGEDPASVLYTRLKKEAAERVGIEFEVVKLEITNNQASIIKQKVFEIGESEDVTGIMIQLPIPTLQGETLTDVIKAIPLNKDVDGLRYPDSGVLPAVTSAAMLIMEEIQNKTANDLWSKKFVVVGSSGFVGSSIVHELEQKGCEVYKVDKNTSNDIIKECGVVISCVGKAGVIQEDMVRDGVVVIDVGSPSGDMTKGVYQKASVSVEVPGGVGPSTIICLMQNVTELSKI